MTTSKHPLSGHEPDPLPNNDLDRTPGIGESRGTTLAGVRTLDEIAGDNTLEGDTANDVNANGGVDPDQRGRTNK